MDLIQITLIIVCVYFTLSMIIKGALMAMYGYGMYQMFKTEDNDTIINDKDEDSYDYDQIPF